MAKKTTASPHCEICGRTAADGVRIVNYQDSVICTDCLHHQYEMCAVTAEMINKFERENDLVPDIPPEDLPCSSGAIRSSSKKKTAASGEEVRKVPSPREIKAYLDDYVIGQEATKRTLSVAVHNHYKRLFDPKAAAAVEARFPGVEIEKSNILIVGPTGTGKTLMASTLAKMLDVPFAIADATTITEAGYVGEDVENILLKLLRAADMDVKKAEKGIVFIDEIDKIARKTGNVSITRDVSGEGVQQALLKIVEGTVANVPPAGGRKHPDQNYIRINTSGILFICGGAFVGLDKIIERRMRKDSFGFTSAASRAKDAKKTASIPEPEDFVQFGLIPEFIGRLPVVTALDELKEDDLVRILTEPRNSVVKQFQKIFAMDGVELSFEPAALRAIAREAIERKTGARGLRSIIERLTNDLMFEHGCSTGEKPLSGAVTITEADVLALRGDSATEGK